MAPLRQQPPPSPRRRLKHDGSSSSLIDSLPEDLLLQILLLLPPDFTYQTAKFVCRKWHKIINSDDFATSQRRRSTNGLLFQPSPELSHHWQPGHAQDRNPIYVTYMGGRIQSFELSYRSKILASCNGLVVELRHGDRNNNNRPFSLHVTNPATKQQPFYIPQLVDDTESVGYDKCGMAYSATSMVYKVTLPYDDDDDDDGAGLYILTAGVDKLWRKVDVGHLSSLERSFLWRMPPENTDGFLYWVVRGSRLLELNVDVETIASIAVPIDPWTNTLLSTGRNVAAFVKTGEYLWETSEMVGGEWRNMEALNAALRPLKSSIHRHFPNDVVRRLGLVAWVKYPEVLAFRFMINEHNLICCYNLDTHEIDTIRLPELEKYRVLSKKWHRKVLNVYQVYDAFEHRNCPVWLSN